MRKQLTSSVALLCSPGLEPWFLTSKLVGTKYMSNFFVSVAPGTSIAAQLIMSYLIVSALTAHHIPEFSGHL